MNKLFALVLVIAISILLPGCAYNSSNTLHMQGDNLSVPIGLTSKVTGDKARAVLVRQSYVVWPWDKNFWFESKEFSDIKFTWDESEGSLLIKKQPITEEELKEDLKDE